MVLGHVDPAPSNLSFNLYLYLLGIPFNDSANWRLTIAEEGQQILGNNLLGLQAGNEPDLYESFVSFFSLFNI